MKTRILYLILSVFSLVPAFGAIVLDRSTGTPRLVSEGRGYIILGGELGNSSATCAEDIETNLRKAAEARLNTVLVPAYWDLTEPSEGVFDFSLTDKVIDEAAGNGLGIVFLWFGAWKNSMSCYTPEWVKRDVARFPRAKTSSGKPLEIVSAFSPELLDSDSKAFLSWLRHISDYDRDGVVKMIQIENEIGMLEDSRDFSPQAEKEYAKGVPLELTRYLAANIENLHPELLKRWTANGRRMTGSWKEVFGDDVFSDEYFMAWNYARYVETLAGEGRKLTSMPFYLNAALNSRGRIPGEYPSAGPLAHLKDFWHAGAPTIDFISPDIYDTGFEGWVGEYSLPDNALFIPEVKREANNAAQAYYVIGHHRALGISPFSIENGDDEYFAILSPAYDILSAIIPIVTSIGETDFMDGVILRKEDPEKIVIDGDTRITFSHFYTLPWDPRATDGSPWRDSGAIVIRLAPDDYLLAGTGVVAKFEDVSEQTDSAVRGEDGFALEGTVNDAKSSESKGDRAGLASVEEVRINPDGTIERVRTLNGDETHQGRHARISVDDNKILRIKTYRYR